MCSSIISTEGHTAAQTGEKIVIAHRGASGYLPEHTLEAKALAHAMGADYIEQDVVMTRDDALVVFHDLTLDRTTDVAEKYPGRAREDGLHYVIDFTLEELRQLQVTEGHVDVDGALQAAYPDLFPSGQSRYSIHTLAEELELIQGLNSSTGRESGVYVEIKSPWFHHQAGKDASRAILQVLGDYGYRSKDDKIYLQTFDFNELKRIRQELYPAMAMDIKLVQLITHNDRQETFVLENGAWLPYDYDWMFEVGGMAEIARYADGVGPNKDMIVTNDSSVDDLHITALVENAHIAGMQVHPFTFRQDPDRIPPYAQDFNRLLEIFYLEVGVDGVFTDYPDLAVSFLNSKAD